MTEETENTDGGMTPTQENFVRDVYEIVMQLKEDLGTIQGNLNAHSEEIHKNILRSRELTERGMASSWYTIPEIELTIKMEYVTYEETVIEEDKEITIEKVKLVPLRKRRIKQK